MLYFTCARLTRHHSIGIGKHIHRNMMILAALPAATVAQLCMMEPELYVREEQPAGKLQRYGGAEPLLRFPQQKAVEKPIV
jgi:hypothetical protein